MPQDDKLFTGSIADIYDSHLVPLIFEEFADDMATRIARDRPAHVLETAAGSGVVTRALATVLDKSSLYTVTDLNKPMLDRAASRQPANDNIHWQAADALDLPFRASMFNAVCCQFGVMFFPDKLLGFQQAHRVLEKGGKFVFNVWDDIQHNEFAMTVTEALATVFHNDPPQFLARTPHGYHDIADITATLKQAGFSDIEVSTKTSQSTAKSAREPAIAYCQGTPLRNEIQDRDPNGLEHATNVAAQALSGRYGSGPVSAKIQGHIFTATA
jgi:ubiquinone/menaquinone biosynthesis C-methylase UbiE